MAFSGRQRIYYDLIQPNGVLSLMVFPVTLVAVADVQNCDRLMLFQSFFHWLLCIKTPECLLGRLLSLIQL